MITLLLKELTFTVLLNVVLNHATIDLSDSYNIENDNFIGIENLNFEDDFFPNPDDGLVEPEPLDTL